MVKFIGLNDPVKNEIISNRLILGMKHLYFEDQSKCYYMMNTKYGLTAYAVDGVIEGKGIIYQIVENGKYYYREFEKRFDISNNRVSLNAYIDLEGNVYECLEYGHISLAHKLQEMGKIPDDFINPSGILWDIGWIQITRNQIYVKNCINNRQLNAIFDLINKYGHELRFLGEFISKNSQSMKKLLEREIW